MLALVAAGGACHRTPPRSLATRAPADRSHAPGSRACNTFRGCSACGRVAWPASNVRVPVRQPRGPCSVWRAVPPALKVVRSECEWVRNVTQNLPIARLRPFGMCEHQLPIERVQIFRDRQRGKIEVLARRPPKPLVFTVFTRWSLAQSFHVGLGERRRLAERLGCNARSPPPLLTLFGRAWAGADVYGRLMLRNGGNVRGGRAPSKSPTRADYLNPRVKRGM
jgi:hypothetical protein